MGKKNKKFIMLFLVLIGVFSFSHAKGENISTSINHKKEIKVIRVSGDMDYPPYEFIDSEGKYKGFNIDIMNAIAIEMGIDVDFVPMKWQDAIITLENKEVDAILGMPRNNVKKDTIEI